MQSEIQGISETTIKIVANTDKLLEIKSLNFHQKTTNPIRIMVFLFLLKSLFCLKQKIENLDGLRNLEELNLSYNQISRIENLSGLIRLRDLNLADNNIKKIENLVYSFLWK